MTQLTIPGSENAKAATPSPLRGEGRVGVTRVRDQNGRFYKALSDAPPGRASARPARAQGLYSEYFAAGALPRLADPEFYEVLREAIPLVDIAIQRLVELDGFVRIEAASDVLEKSAREWSESVMVGQLGQGFPLAVSLWAGEMYEQGVAIMEMVAAKNGSDLAALYIPDSKRLWFTSDASGRLSLWYQPTLRVRRQLGSTMEISRRIIQPSWTGLQYVGFDPRQAVLLEGDSIIIGQHRPENQEPHGVSAIRSIPFIAKILATISNAVLNTWERFGDPAYVGVYKGKLAPDAAKKASDSLAADLASVVGIKRSGGSADLTRVIGREDDFQLRVLGADNQVLDLAIPAKFTAEHITAGVGLCASVLGLPPAGDESIAKSIILAASRTRFEFRRPALTRVVEAALRLRGHAFKHGDVTLVQEQPDLDDVLKKAQARFMDAQRLSIYGVGFDGDRPTSIRPASPAPSAPPAPPPPAKSAGRVRSGAKAAIPPARARVDVIAQQTASKMEPGWMALAEKTIQALGLPAPGESSAQKEFAPLPEGGRRVISGGEGAHTKAALTQQQIDQLTALGQGYIEDLKQKSWLDAPMEMIIDLGVASAIASAGAPASTLSQALRAQLSAQASAQLFDLVKSDVFLFLREQVSATLAQAAEMGANPQDAAQWLWAAFDGKKYEWARLARTEMADVFSAVKMEEWTGQQVTALTSIITSPSCAVCGPMAGTYPLGSAPRFPRDTHPHCTCDSRPASPSELAAIGLQPGGANPHPNPSPEAGI